MPAGQYDPYIRARQAHESGNLRLFSSGEVSPGTGEAFAIAIENPSDSGVDLVPYFLTSANSVGYVPAFVSENPTNAPSGFNGTEGGIIDTDREADETPAATGHAGTVGTDLDNRNGLVLPLHDTYPLPWTMLKIPPGATLAIQGGETGGLLAGEDAIGMLYYAERPR